MLGLEMTNHTRHKLNESGYFLDMARKSSQEDEIFSFNLSAFLSAARSITFFMQKQYNDCSWFEAWYCIKRREISGDAELKYLNAARVESIHKKEVLTASTRVYAPLLFPGSRTAKEVEVVGSARPCT